MASAVTLRSRRLKLDEYLPYRLSVAANAVSQFVARACAVRFGLQPPQWRLLAVLGEEGARTQQELSVRTVMDKVMVMRAARALNQRKLVGREPNAADGRSHRLFLTAAGKRMYRQIAPMALEYQGLLTTGISEVNLRQLHRSLRALQASAMALTRIRPP